MYMCFLFAVFTRIDPTLDSRDIILFMKFIYVIKEYIKIAFKSLKYIYSLDKKGTFWRLSIIIMFPILSNSISIITARLTDAMQKDYGTGIMQYILPAFIFLIVFTILDNVFGFLSRRINITWNSKLSQLVFAKQLEDKSHFSIPMIDSSDYEELKQRVEFGAAGNGRYAQMQLTRSIPNFLTIIINLIFALYISISYNWVFSVIILISQIPSFYFLFVRIFATRRKFESTLDENKYYGIFSGIFSSYQGLKDAKSSNNSKKLLNIYRDGMEKIIEDRLNIHRYYMNILFGFELLTTAIIFIMQYYVLKDVVLGNLLIGQAALIILQISRLESQIGELSTFLPDQYENTVAAKYLFLQSETTENKDRLIGDKFEIKNDLIELKNIDFKYEDMKLKSLHKLNDEIDTIAKKYFGLNKTEINKTEFKESDFKLTIDTLTINKGEKIAVVGKNGNGKTTFIQILLNLYQPQSGDVTLFGNNLKDLSQEDIMSNFSVLYQDYSQSPLKVHEYIGLSEKNEIDISKVKEVAKIATADEFIEKWPDQYIQQTGVYMKGVKPSKGQYQKLALARTLYKDSPIIILDEPTASIDSISSKKIFENLKQIPKDKTVILVSHNMIDIVDFADRIIVFEKGRIVGDGSHDDLLKSCVEYKELYESEVR